MATADGGHSSERRLARRGSSAARRASFALYALVLAAAVLGSVLTQTSAAAGPGFSFTPSTTEPYAACGIPTPGHAECLAILVPGASALSSGALRQANPATATQPLGGTGIGGGYAPADLRSAYNLPSESAGSGQTVAIVDAFNDPNAESDLATYRSHYAISACTTGNGCFRKVNQSGGSSLPEANAGWAVEISLDLDMASAACPKCHILLVEASSNTNGNLEAAEDEAATLGATEISNSWGGGESSEETSEDKYFHHAGIPITASAGDAGYEVEYPAASQYVIAVGGTKLVTASNSRGWSETAWSGTGSGCSAVEPKPSWQTDTGCAKRTNNDVAAVASQETPVSVADSFELPSEFSKPEPGWTLVAGTSVSSPLIAGTMALANAYTKSFPGAEALYKEASQNGTGVLDDVTSGNNVKKHETSCGTYLCIAGPGYDGPTGLGSPYGAPVVLPPAPTVVTKSASAVAQTAATLSATVNPNDGEVSKCEFEYGPTTAYGKAAACATLPGSGESAVAVSASVAGLTANTTYHFRISATNAGGTSTGSDETFKTAASPPAVTTCFVSGITQTSARLCAKVNPNGIEVSECVFEYGTTTSYGTAVPCTPAPCAGSSPVEVTAEATGLTANTTYHYRVSATNSSGVSRGPDEAFKTLPNPPAVVTEQASSIAETSATLNAKVNPDGGLVSECKLEYGLTTSYESSGPCSSLPGSGESPVAVSATATGLIANTTYHVRISATNAGGTSKGADQTFTTPPPPHFYQNDAKLVEGQPLPTIEWGTIKLTNANLGEIECRTAAGGSVENPTGGGAAVGKVEAFATYSCLAESCTSRGGKIKVTPEKLPWSVEVVEEAGPIFRSRTTGINIAVNCEGVLSTVFHGEWRPSAISGSAIGSKPSTLEFGAGSGELESEAGGGELAGLLKIQGSSREELLDIASP